MNKKVICIIAILAIFVLVCPAHAAETVGTAQGNGAKKMLSVLLDNALSLTILFIFISALVGFFLKGRAVDKCLKDFDDFSIAIEDDNGSQVAGKMKLYPTGMELQFEEPVELQGTPCYSHIVYKSEYSGIQKICRYQDALSARNFKRREKEIKRTYRPGLLRKSRRWLRNMLGTFRDAFVQSMGVVVGQMKKKPGVIKSQEKQIKSIGAEIIGSTGNAYDPILEKYVGRQVVVEVEKGEVDESYCGIFKEYSAGFLQILNISVPQQFTLYSDSGQETKKGFSPLSLEAKPKGAQVKNIANYPVFLEKAKMQQETKEIGNTLEAGKSLEINFGKKNQDDEIVVFALRRVDMIFPRSKAVIRHVADQHKMDWKNAIKLNF